MITFETQEDFEKAVRTYIENNLKIDGSTIAVVVNKFGDRAEVLQNVCLTFDRASPYFSEVFE